MKTNHKLIVKLVAIALLMVMVATFTQCIMPTNTTQIGDSEKTESSTIITKSDGPKDEGQIINEAQVEVGMKSHEQLLHTMSTLTGVPVTNTSIQSVYNQVATTLPTDNDVKVFLPPHQLAITKLAAEFCHVLVENTTLRTQLWPGFNFGAASATAFSSAGRDLIIENTLNVFWGEAVSDEEKLMAADELQLLIDDSLMGEQSSTTTTRNIVKAVCTSALSSAHVSLL